MRFPGLLFFSLYATWVVSAGVSVRALWSSPVEGGENDRCMRKYISVLSGATFMCVGVGMNVGVIVTVTRPITPNVF